MKGYFLLVAITAIGLFARTFPVSTEDLDAGYLFPDDPPYHMLRVQRILEGPVDFMAPDPTVAHPDGGVACWPWGFDIMVATWVKFFGAGPNRQSALPPAAWLIPILGVALIPLIKRIGNGAIGEGPALVSAAIAALLPAHISYTLLGRVDHHVMEPLLAIIAMMAPMTTIFAHGEDVTRGRYGMMAVGGLALGVSLGFIPAGLPMVLPILIASGVAMAYSRPFSAILHSFGTVIGTAMALSMSPYPWTWVFYSPSLLHLSLVVAVAGGIFVLAALRMAGNGMLKTFAIGAFAGIALALSFFGLADGSYQSLIAGLRYVASDRFTALSLEARPLLSDPERALSLIGALGLCAPIGGLSMMLTKADGLVRGKRVYVGALIVIFSIFALSQRRFLVVATPFIALGSGELVRITWRMLTARRTGLHSTWHWPAMAVFVLAAQTPAIVDLLTMTPTSPQDRLMAKTADLVAGRPHPEGMGAMVPWGVGHLFQYRAAIPTLCDNFFGVPVNDTAMLRCVGLLLETDPARIAESLSKYRLHTVVLAPPHPDQTRVQAQLLGLNPMEFVDHSDRFTPLFARTFQAQLGLWAQNAAPGEDGPFGMTLVARMVESETDAPGSVTAEVLVFEVSSASREQEAP